ASSRACSSASGYSTGSRTSSIRAPTFWVYSSKRAPCHAASGGRGVERSFSVQLGGTTPVEVGTLWSRIRTGKETASFEYAASWIRRPGAFALDPELPLGPGRFHTQRALFNAFADAAPDRWGQTLLRRNERVRARLEGRAPRTLFAIDFLILVDDE